MKTEDCSSNQVENLSREENQNDRREFLKKCAKFTAYATPAIVMLLSHSSGAQAQVSPA
jgi:hypothetical protein